LTLKKNACLHVLKTKIIMKTKTKVFFVLLGVTISSMMIVACGNSNSGNSNATSDFPSKLSAAYKAESAFETALIAAPDLATAKASNEFAAMQKALDEAKAAAQTEDNKADLAKLQKIVDVLVNQ
jgi:hypothetical protein